MLITEDKLAQLQEVMTTKKAKRAVEKWAINQGQVTMDTLNALDEVNNKALAILAKFVNEEVQKRGL
tara:strand:+ start:295 stop:495 length:201 start_codon:yes stop_codon:yes gene_type:complete